MKRALAAAIGLILFGALAWAGVQWSEMGDGMHGGSIEVYRADIEASTAGAASGTLQAAGELVQVAVVPKTTRLYVNTTQLTTFNIYPAAAFDCTLTDRYGQDVINGQLANLINTTAQRFWPTRITTGGTVNIYEPPVRGLDLACTNMGTSSRAEVHIYLRH